MLSDFTTKGANMKLDATPPDCATVGAIMRLDATSSDCAIMMLCAAPF